MFSYRDICKQTCTQKHDIRIDDIITKREFELPFSDESYHLSYAPVGNYPFDPLVIISGKTTSGDSSDLFKEELLKNNDLYGACVKSIFSNMKERLFIYLREIELFGYLKKYLDFWKTSDYEGQWNKIFTSPQESIKSGIQVTQAFNCAILNKDRHKRSSQPPKRIFNKIYNEIGCMFKHFNITNNLKLIIFLDTPGSLSSFHQIDYWEKSDYKNTDVKIISITHPSTQNSVIYNNISNLYALSDSNRKKKRAIKLLEKAKETIKNL